MKTSQDLSESEVESIMRDGFELSSKAVRELGEHLKSSPNDLIARAKLLAFYRRRERRKGAKECILQHALWMTENQPWHNRFFHALLIPDAESVEERDLLTTAWMKQIALHPLNALVLGNAGFYLSWFDFDQGNELMERAQGLDPENSYWTHMLGQFCYSQMMIVDSNTRQGLANRLLSYAKRLSELDGGPVPGLVANEWVPVCLTILGDTAGDTSFVAKLKPPKRASK